MEKCTFSFFVAFVEKGKRKIKRIFYISNKNSKWEKEMTGGTWTLIILVYYYV